MRGRRSTAPTGSSGCAPAPTDCEGYDASAIAGPVVVGASGVTTFDLGVASGFTIDGVVVDASGRTVAGARVSAHLVERGPGARWLSRAVRTKGDGTFAIRGLP